MNHLFDIDDPESRRSCAVYDIRQDWRRQDQGNFYVTTSTLVSKAFSTKRQAILWAASWVEGEAA